MPTIDPRRFEAVLGPDGCRGFLRWLERAAERLRGRRLWHVNSTEEGGGAAVIWSCHVGVDHPNRPARAAWDFLRPYVQAADAHVFSRHAYAWDGLDRDRLAVIPPCIDAFAPKNQPLDGEQVAAILAAAGIVDAGGGGGDPAFHRLDGSRARVGRRAELIQEAPCPPRRRSWRRCRAGTG